MQALKEIIIKEAFADAALKGKISDRMYPSELAAIEKPSFPCVNFKIDTGQEWDYTMEMTDVNVLFWCFSIDSFDEAYSIHGDLRPAIAQKRGKGMAFELHSECSCAYD